MVKGPTGAPERKPFDTRRESTEREWFLVSMRKYGRVAAACTAQNQTSCWHARHAVSALASGTSLARPVTMHSAYAPRR